MDETDENLTATMLSQRARDTYHRDARFRATLQATVHRAMQKHGPIDPDDAYRAALDIAMDVGAILYQGIYENDAEVATLKAERDSYKKMAEDALLLSPVPRMFVRMPLPAPPTT